MTLLNNGLEDMNPIFIKNLDNSVSYTEGVHHCRVAGRLPCERGLAMETYMLCPQHGLLFQGSDLERFSNWASELQIYAQHISQAQHRRSRSGMSLEAIASSKNADKAELSSLSAQTKLMPFGYKFTSR